MSNDARRGKRLFAGFLAAVMALSVAPVLGFTGVAGADGHLEAADPIGEGNFCEDVPMQEPFTDVTEADPSYEEIVCLVATEVTTGVTATTYEPNSFVTRRQMALFLTRVAAEANRLEIDDNIEELPEPAANEFDDVEDEEQFIQDAISQVAQAGIAEGFPDGDYRPAAPVSRRQMAAFIDRLYEYLTGEALPDAAADNFSDDNEDSAEAQASTNAVAEAGIFIGNTDGTFAPAQEITRRQMANVLTRTFEVLFENGEIEQWSAEEPPPSSNQTFAVTPMDEAINLVSTTAGPDIDRGAREYTVAAGDDPVSIALFPIQNVSIDENGVVTFVDGLAGLSGDGRADGIRTTDAVIETVNGVSVSDADGYVSDIATNNGEVTFTIDSTDPNTWVWPVVFEDTDNDDQLDLDADDAPTEAFGVGGPKLWIPEEAAFGTNDVGRIQIIRSDVAEPFVTVRTDGDDNIFGNADDDNFTLYYEETAIFQYASGQPQALISVDEFEEWASGPGVDGLGFVPGDELGFSYNSNSSNTILGILDDTPMPVGTLTGVASDTNFDGVNDDAALDWDAPTNPDVVEYDIYRAVQNSDGTFPPLAPYDTETDGTAYNDQGLAADTYRYGVVAVNGQSGQRSLLSVVEVTIVDEAIEPAPFSDDTIVLSSSDADTDLDGVDPLALDPAADQVTVPFVTESPLQVAAGATIDLRGENGQLVRLTNGSNATFSVGGPDQDELTITFTAAEYTPVEDPFGAGPIQESDYTEIVASTGITSGGGEWNLARSGCNDIYPSNCGVINQRVFTLGGNSVANDELPESQDIDHIVANGNTNTITVLNTASEIDDGERFEVYDFVTGQMVASGTFESSDVPGTTVSADIAPGQRLLFVYRDSNPATQNGVRQISNSSVLLVPNEVPEVVSVNETDNTSLDLIDVFWDEVVTLTGGADDFEVYDSTNSNLVARGEVVSSKTNDTFTVDLDTNLVDGNEYWLRVASGVAQDSDNNPNPAQAIMFTFQLVNDAPTIDSLSVDGDAASDGGTATTNDSSPVVNGQASDTDGTIADVEYSVDGGAFQSATAADGGFDEVSEAFTFTIAGPLSDGDHSLVVRAIDNDGGQDTWSVTVTVGAAAPTIQSVLALPGSDEIRVTFSEDVTCPGTAGALAAWVYDDQSVADDNDGSPSAINQSGGTNTCDLVFVGLDVDDFGLLDYNQPGAAADQVQDTSGTPLATTLDEDVVDGVAPTFDSVDAAGADGTATVDAIFSEDLDCTTVSAGDFAVEVAGSGRNVASVACLGDTVTLTLEPPLLAAGQTVEVTYDATAAGGIDDASGDNTAATQTRSDTVTV